MTCVTGVSGSGKSSLINEMLYKTLARKLNRARIIPGKHNALKGWSSLTRLSILTSRPSEERRVPIPQPTPVYLTRSGTFLLQPLRTQKQEVIKREDSALM